MYQRYFSPFKVKACFGGKSFSAKLVLEGTTVKFVSKPKKGKLAKQPITLGDYYEEQMVYSVSGIDKDTQIAYPMDDYSEGMKTVSGE